MAEEDINPNEEEQQLEETEGEEESQAEEQPEEVEATTEVADEEEVQGEEEPEEAEPAPSRREQLRVQQLLKKYGPPPEQKPEPAPQPGTNYRDMLDAPDEVYDQLEQTQQQYGQQQYQQGQNTAMQQVNTVKWETMLNIDAPQVEKEYDMLDPKSKNFHPAISDAVTKLYLQTVGYDDRTGMVSNPNVRYREFVDSYMEFADEIANTKVATTTKNIAKQAANTGLRPDGSSAKRLNLNQPIENMSDAELKAYGRKLGLEA